jgi:hypothetical protein
MQTERQAAGFPLFTVESARLWLCSQSADLQYMELSAHFTFFSSSFRVYLSFSHFSFSLHSLYLHSLGNIPFPVLSSVTFYISLFVHFLLFTILSIILPP